MSFYSRKEIKDMVAYLRLILMSDDNYSFRRVVNEPKRKIGPSIIAKLEVIGDNRNLSLFDRSREFFGNNFFLEFSRNSGSPEQIL